MCGAPRQRPNRCVCVHGLCLLGLHQQQCYVDSIFFPFIEWAHGRTTMLYALPPPSLQSQHQHGTFHSLTPFSALVNCTCLSHSKRSISRKWTWHHVNQQCTGYSCPGIHTHVHVPGTGKIFTPCANVRNSGATQTKSLVVSFKNMYMCDGIMTYM